MSKNIDYGLPNFRTLYDAIVSAIQSDDVAFSLQPLKDAQQLAHFRQAPHLQNFLDEIRAEAEQVNNAPFPPLTFTLFHQYEATGERAPYEQVYFARRRALASLTLTLIIDGRDDYLDSFHNLLWEICNEYTWALPAHLPVGVEAVRANRLPPSQIIDLFASETAHMLAEIIHLLGDKLPNWLIYRIHDEIERRIFQPLFHHPQTFKWERDAHNWAAVCGGCVGMTALLLETDRERLVGMIDRIMRSMDSFLSGFGADGGCPEGISYWSYGFGYYVYFADLLKRYTHGKINLLTSQHVAKIAHFPQAVSLGKGRFINYSDASETGAIPAGLGSYLTEQLAITIPDLKAPSFHQDHIYRWANITRDLVWSNPDYFNHPVADGTVYLDQLAWVIDRRTINQSSVMFSAKGGHNDEPHNHNDLGHFLLTAGDEPFLIDLGAGVYTRQYFSAQRYDVIHTNSYGHSVPIINGMGQQAGASHRAEVLTYQTYPKSITYVLDLTKAYAVPELKSFIRAFDWSVDDTENSATLTVSDHVQFSQPSHVESCFISYRVPRIDTTLIQWTSEHATLTLQFDRDLFDVAIDTIQTQDHHLQPITAYRLRLIALQQLAQRNDQFVFNIHFS